MVAGVVVALAGAGLPFLLILTGRITGGVDVATAACLVLIGLGVMLVIAPLTAARIGRAIETAPVIRRLQAEPRGGDFSGPGEARAAYGAVLTRPAAWLRIAGPWIALGWVVPAALGWTLSSGRPLGLGALLLEFLVLLLVIVLPLPIIAVAWCRLVLEDRLPTGVVLPDRASLALTWRAIFLLIATGTMTQSAATLAHWLDRQLGAGAPVKGEQVVTWTLGALIALFLSLAALIVPARAVDDRRMTIRLSSAAVRRLGFGYLLGLAWIGLPWLAASLGLDRLGSLAGPGKFTPAAFALSLAGLVVTAGFTAVLAGYLSRIYQRVSPAISRAETGPAPRPATVRPS